MDTAYVLHRWPYQESSLMCDLLTRSEGRVRVIAKGARRPKSPWRSVLQPFTPLQVEYRGRSELQTLTHAEAQASAFASASAPAATLQSTQLYSAFYMNELLQRLTRLHQPLEQLFDEYAQGLQQLLEKAPVEPILRRFEWQLLQHLGLAFDWYTDCVSGAELPLTGALRFQPGAGFSALDSGISSASSVPAEYCYQAADIAALANLQVQNSTQLKLLKRLMRQALALYLGEQPLRSRELFSQQTTQD